MRLLWLGSGAWSDKARLLAWVHSIYRMYPGALYHNSIYIYIYIYMLFYTLDFFEITQYNSDTHDARILTPL